MYVGLIVKFTSHTGKKVDSEAMQIRAAVYRRGLILGMVKIFISGSATDRKSAG